ncbi:Uncharacterised protein [Candidatus Tiddalikarchaeum anstoanum]|nr:Uncharacterised protein [Candidatus Tiddalikarchaeum anstoanum]
MNNKKLALKIKSVLCYSGLPAFIFLNSKENIIRFHAKQGVLLFITAVLALFIPIIGWILVWPFVFVNSFIAAVKAWDLKMWSTPITNIVKTFKFNTEVKCFGFKKSSKKRS